MVTSKENLIGARIFLISIVLAIIIGFLKPAASPNTLLTNTLYATLVLLGLFVGYMTRDDKSSTTFLFAGLALIIVSGMGQNSLIFISNLSPILGALNNVLSALIILFIPATIVVAIKTVYSISKV